MNYIIPMALLLIINITGMESDINKIHMGPRFAKCTVPFDKVALRNRTLSGHIPPEQVYDFSRTYQHYGDQILQAVSLDLAKCYYAFPQNERLAVVRRYVQAVTLRLTLIPDEQKLQHIDWAQWMTPTDLREDTYICDGTPLSQEVCCSKVNTTFCQQELAQTFAAIVKEFSPKP